MVKKLFLVFSLLSFIGVVSAQTTRYVTDETKIPVRTGRSTQNKILRMLPSGTSVNVLETADDGYSHVRTPEGVEGWMLSRYLMAERSGRDRLAELQNEYDKLQKENTRLKQERDGLGSVRGDLEKENQSVQSQNRKLREELESLRRKAARPIEISRRNTVLQKQLDEEREKIRQLDNENQLLKEETKRNWFVTGAVVTLGSLFLGLIIPRIPWRKRRSWDEL
jgi:SH3 domain protein